MYFKQINEIVSGTKTQTRRVCKPPKLNAHGVVIGGEYPVSDDGQLVTDCSGMWMSEAPIHAVYSVSSRGDRIKWQTGRNYAVQPGRGQPGVYVNFNHPCYGYDIWEGTEPVSTDKGMIDWRDFAPRQGYHPLRIRLLSIRREKLHDISEADAVAEGCTGHDVYTGYTNEDEVSEVLTPRDEYRDLWQSINGPKSWELNPAVWALTFEVVQ